MNYKMANVLKFQPDSQGGHMITHGIVTAPRCNPRRQDSSYRQMYTLPPKRCRHIYTVNSIYTETTCSSVDTYTLESRIDNLEIVLSLLQNSLHRMEHAMDMQTVKANEILQTVFDENGATGNRVLDSNRRNSTKKMGRRLRDLVVFMTDNSKIIRHALSEQTTALNLVVSKICQQKEALATKWQNNTSESYFEVDNLHSTETDKGMKLNIVGPENLSTNDVSDYAPPSPCSKNKISSEALHISPWKQTKSTLDNNFIHSAGQCHNMCMRKSYVQQDCHTPQEHVTEVNNGHSKIFSGLKGTYV